MYKDFLFSNPSAYLSRRKNTPQAPIKPVSPPKPLNIDAFDQQLSDDDDNNDDDHAQQFNDWIEQKEDNINTQGYTVGEIADGDEDKTATKSEAAKNDQPSTQTAKASDDVIDGIWMSHTHYC